MNIPGLLQSKWFTLQETQSLHDSMKIPKMEFFAYTWVIQ